MERGKIPQILKGPSMGQKPKKGKKVEEAKRGTQSHQREDR